MAPGVLTQIRPASRGRLAAAGLHLLPALQQQRPLAGLVQGALALGIAVAMAHQLVAPGHAGRTVRPAPPASGSAGVV